MKSLATLGNELYSAKTSIAFVGKRRIWYLIAVVIVLGSATLLATVGLTPGIDFKGGSEITITGAVLSFGASRQRGPLQERPGGQLLGNHHGVGVGEGADQPAEQAAPRLAGR